MIQSASSLSNLHRSISVVSYKVSSLQFLLLIRKQWNVQFNEHTILLSITILLNNQIYQMGSTCQKCLINESEIPARDKVKDLSMYEQQRMIENRQIQTERQSKINIQSAALKINTTVEQKQNTYVHNDEGLSLNEHNSSISPIKQQPPLQQELPVQINKEQQEDEENMGLHQSELYVLAFKSELKSKMVTTGNKSTLKNKQEQLYVSQTKQKKSPQNPQKQVSRTQSDNHPKQIKEQIKSQDEFVLLDPVFDEKIDIKNKIRNPNIVQVKQDISSEVQPIAKAQISPNKFISNI